MLLTSVKAKHEIISHRKVYTAYDAAATQHLDLKMVAKILLLKGNNSNYYLLIIPAGKKFDQAKVKKGLNKYLEKQQEKKITKVAIVSEKIIMNNFTKGKGSLLPFGSLYKIPTLVDQGLLRQKKISLSAGSFTESLLITPAWYEKVENPIKGSFSK